MQARVCTSSQNWPQRLRQDSINLHRKLSRVAFVDNPVRGFPISHVFTHDDHAQWASLCIAIARAESFGINAMRHVNHPVLPKPELEIFELASRHYYRYIDSCKQVLLHPFEAIRHANSGQVERHDERTRKQPAPTKQ
jgi:hypothetical protein